MRLGVVEGGAERRTIEAGLLGDVEDLLRRRHIAVLRVEGAGDAGLERQRHLRQQAAGGDDGAAGRLGVVGEGLALEESSVERLAGGGAHLLPGLADVGSILLRHRLGVAGAQPAHDDMERKLGLELLRQRRDDGGKSVAPRAHGVGEVDELVVCHAWFVPSLSATA